MLYSIIIPCYNSEHTIEKLIELIINELEKLEIKKYEIVLINDFSKDNTLLVLKKLAAQYSFIRVLSLGKNFGQVNAIMAGLNQAKGDVIINMDDDLQTSPSEFKKLIDKFNEGHEIVIARYASKKHSFFRNLLTIMDDKFDQLCLERPAGLKFTSFWIISKHIRDEVIKYKKSFPYMEGLFLQVSRDIVNVEVNHFERAEGKSGYNLKKLIKLFLNSTNFTIIPLRIATFLGVSSSLVGFIVAVIIIIRKLIYSDIVAGWTSLIVITLIFSGAILTSIGVLGEYIGRIFMCINNSPQYVIREKVNCEDEK